MQLPADVDWSQLYRTGYGRGPLWQFDMGDAPALVASDLNHDLWLVRPDHEPTLLARHWPSIAAPCVWISPDGNQLLIHRGEQHEQAWILFINEQR